MNQRLKRKIEKRRRQQICEALDLCLQINGLQESKRSLTGGHPTAFFEFNGHVAGIKAHIHDTGWADGKLPDQEVRAYLDKPGEIDRFLSSLRKLKKDLHSCSCGRSKR